MYVQGYEDLRSLCRRYECENEIAAIVRAKPKTVRKRLRRYGIRRWPKQRKKVR